MISAVIPVKNRSNARIQRCIESFRNYVDEIIVVDYGSDKPVKVKHAKMIRYTSNKVWNKSHALNIGIKATSRTNEYIMSVDCDMIIPNKVMDQVIDFIAIYPFKERFIINTNVRRIELKDLKNGDFDKSRAWFVGGIRSNIYTRANGGIQVYPRKWAFKVRGYDENLVYWGGMDNDFYERAAIDNLELVNINSPMYHQEHDKQKEAGLKNKDEQESARYIRMEKTRYLDDKLNKFKIKGASKWGTEQPNQNRFLRTKDNWKKIKEKDELKRQRMIKKIMRKVKNNEKTFKDHGIEYKIYQPEQPK